MQFWSKHVSPSHLLHLASYRWVESQSTQIQFLLVKIKLEYALQEDLWIPIKQLKNASSWSTPELNQSDTHCRFCALSTKGFAVQEFSCLTSQVHWADGDVNVEHKGEPWSESLLLATVVGSSLEEEDQRQKLSYFCLPCSPFLSLLCSGTEALGSCSSCAEWELRSSTLAQISPCVWRDMDRRGTGTVWVWLCRVCPGWSLSLVTAPGIIRVTLYWKDPWGRTSTLEPQVLPKPAAALQTLANSLHRTTVGKCKIHLPRFNPLHLSFPHSRAVTSTSNSFPQAAEFMELCIENLMQKWAWCSASLRWGFSFGILIKAFATANV